MHHRDIRHLYAATVNLPNELARDRISILQPGQKIVIADSNPKFLQENLRIRLGFEDELLRSGENGNQLNRWNLPKKKMVEAARIALASKEAERQASTSLVQQIYSR